jgi:hypothetical protein
MGDGLDCPGAIVGVGRLLGFVIGVFEILFPELLEPGECGGTKA